MSQIVNGGGGGSGTVTNTGGNLTANAVVLGAGGSDTKVSTGVTTNGASELDLGVAGTSGVLGLNGSTSGKATITAPAVAGTTSNPVVITNSLAPSTNNAASLGGAAANWLAGYIQQIGTGGANDIQFFTNNGAAGLKFLNTGQHLSFTSGKGQHINTQAANNDISGTVATSSSTTASVVFTTNYTATPVVILTPQTTGITSWFISAVSVSGFTVTVAPSGTFTFGYHVIGNPN